MKYKFKKLNAKLIYKLFNFEACFFLGDEIGQSIRTSLYLKADFKHFFKKSIFKVTLSDLFRRFIIIGDDFPKMFMLGELKELDYLEMWGILEDGGIIEDVENIDKLNLWVVFKDDIKDAIIVGKDEYEGLKILNKELGYEN